MGTITQYENVTFTVAGANPQTKTVQVAFTVDTNTGIGTASIPYQYTGANAGTDTVTAALPSFNYNSNTATVVWQGAPPFPIAISDSTPVGIIAATSNYNGWQYNSPQSFISTMDSKGSLYLNQASRTDSSTRHNTSPSHFYLISSTGAFTGGSVATPNNGNLELVVYGSFIVTRAGQITFNFITQDNFIFGIGNSSSAGSGVVTGVVNNIYLNTSQSGFSRTTTPFKGYQIWAAWNAPRHSGDPSNGWYCTVNFSAPGVYPFELDFNGGGDGNELGVGYNGGNTDYRSDGASNFAPYTVATAPSAPPAGSQNLVLTPTGGATNLLMQGQQVTLNLALTATFGTRPYIPLLEGSQGQVYIYNDPNNPTFSFPSFYGSTPDFTSAAASDFALTGDNTAWQGQVSVAVVNSKFSLLYGGSYSNLFQSGVESTNLTVTQDDIAWFNASKTSYDTFQATASGGGKFATIPVYYLLNPNYPAGSAVTVSPTTVVQDGTQKTFTVTLARPLPPTQNNTTMGVNFTGTTPTGVTVTANMGSGNLANWITSYTVKATWATSLVAATSTMLLSFTAPQLTFLGLLGGANPDQFYTVSNFAYPASQQPQATITLQASSAPAGPPYNVSLGVSLVLNNYTLTATWVSYANNFANTQFYANETYYVQTPYGSYSGQQRVTLGTVQAANAVITAIGGGKYQAVFTLANAAAYSPSLTYQFGYVGTCTDNSSVNYVDPTTYI